MIKSLFITGTGTDVGKTFVTALILKKLRQSKINAGYYKAALSGAKTINKTLVAGDAKHVCQIADIKDHPSSLISYIYKAEVSPHLAANLEGNPVETTVVKRDFDFLKSKYDYLCVEGSGGIVCPIRIDETQTLMQTDIIKLLNLSVVVVASAQLGTINSTVLTVEHLRAKKISINGIILNHYDESDIMHQDNKTQIEMLTGVAVIAMVGENDKDLNININKLASVFQEA